eukprot:748626-Hanusia_phi.AAC.4
MIREDIEHSTVVGQERRRNVTKQKLSWTKDDNDVGRQICETSVHHHACHLRRLQGDAQPKGENIYEWEGFVNGPVCLIRIRVHVAHALGQEGTPYEGGRFKFEMKFPAEYPFKPPKLNFTTKVLHPNITDDGKVCLDIISEGWNPAVSLRQVCCLLALSVPPRLIAALDHFIVAHIIYGSQSIESLSARGLSTASRHIRSRSVPHRLPNSMQTTERHLMPRCYCPPDSRSQFTLAFSVLCPSVCLFSLSVCLSIYFTLSLSSCTPLLSAVCLQSLPQLLAFIAQLHSLQVRQWVQDYAQ